MNIMDFITRPHQHGMVQRHHDVLHLQHQLPLTQIWLPLPVTRPSDTSGLNPQDCASKYRAEISTSGQLSERTHAYTFILWIQ